MSEVILWAKNALSSVLHILLGKQISDLRCIFMEIVIADFFQPTPHVSQLTLSVLASWFCSSEGRAIEKAKNNVAEKAIN